jgi:hypothetical protein
MEMTCRLCGLSHALGQCPAFDLPPPLELSYEADQAGMEEPQAARPSRDAQAQGCEDVEAARQAKELRKAYKRNYMREYMRERRLAVAMPRGQRQGD